MTPLRVVVADDSEVVRRALLRSLTAAGCDVLGEAEDADALVALVDRVSPHVALVDLWLGQVCAVGAIRTLRARRPPVPCLLLSAACDEQIALAAAAGGCAARVAKQDLAVDQLVELLQRAAANPAAPVVPRFVGGNEDPVLTLLLEGRTDSEIAWLLGLDEVEVRRLVAAWLERLGLGNGYPDHCARVTRRPSSSRV